MVFNIIATFRNNEKYLSNFLLPTLRTLEKDFNFHYYFYENDSEDNTRSLLKKFLQGKNGKFKYETKGNKILKRDINTLFLRVSNISDCRNKLLGLRPFKGEWSIIIDSDIYFHKNILKSFINIDKPKDLIALGCNGKSDLKCNQHKECSLYYDTLALIYENGELFHNNSSYQKSQCCPFKDKEDREKWFNGELVKVNSAFGGLSFYKTDIINKPELKYELVTSIDFIKNKKPLYCEHWDFNKKLRKFGNIYITPQIIVKNIEE